MQLIRKISGATVYGGKGDVLEAVMKAKPKAVPLYRVIGICNGTRTGKSKFDDKEEAQDWRALLGQFEATNAATGEVFRSGVCFMPAYIVDTIAGQLSDETTAVRFGFDIHAAYDEKSITSYVYGATPLIEPGDEDPLKALAATLPNTAKALAAPVKKS